MSQVIGSFIGFLVFDLFGLCIAHEEDPTRPKVMLQVGGFIHTDNSVGGPRDGPGFDLWS